MNYRILDIDSIERTILIEWEDGLILNHAIPVDHLSDALKKQRDAITTGEGLIPAIDSIIKKERHDLL